MEDFCGTIIEESLENISVLKQVQIIHTKIETVTEKHKTPWIKQWTLHSVSVTKKDAKKVAHLLSSVLDSKHAWYADFKNEKSILLFSETRFLRLIE